MLRATNNGSHDSVLFTAGLIPVRSTIKKLLWSIDSGVCVYMRWSYCVGAVIVEKRWRFVSHIFELLNYTVDISISLSRFHSTTHPFPKLTLNAITG